jgi:hypothetical protein
MILNFLRMLQNIFWVRLTCNFVITDQCQLSNAEPRIKCRFVLITNTNYARVSEFRERERVSQYYDKLLQGEIGYFVEHHNKVIASIWATVNKKNDPMSVRTYVKLMPNEALIHDVVSGENFRGMGVGAYMISSIASILLQEYQVSKVIVDVKSTNRASLRMLQKTGLNIDHKMIYVSAFNIPLFHVILKNYAYDKSITNK